MQTRDSPSAAAAQDPGVASAGALSPCGSPFSQDPGLSDRGTLFTMVCFVRCLVFSAGQGESCELVTVLTSVCMPWDGQHSGVTGPPGSRES